MYCLFTPTNHQKPTTDLVKTNQPTNQQNITKQTAQPLFIPLFAFFATLHLDGIFCVFFQQTTQNKPRLAQCVPKLGLFSCEAFLLFEIIFGHLVYCPFQYFTGGPCARLLLFDHSSNILLSNAHVHRRSHATTAQLHTLQLYPIHQK